MANTEKTLTTSVENDREKNPQAIYIQSWDGHFIRLYDNENQIDNFPHSFDAVPAYKSKIPWEIHLDDEHDIADKLEATPYQTPTGTIAAVIQKAVELGIVTPVRAIAKTEKEYTINTSIKKHEKLVRDGIPEKIRNNDEIPITKTLDTKEYRKSLFNKLHEELQEISEAKSKKQLLEEFADLLEVLEASAKANGLPWVDVLAEKKKKKTLLGGFEKRTYLLSTRKK